MSLISQSIKNLKSGISQQPDILRYPEQGAAQVNGWSSETQGLKKRSPTIFDRVIGTAAAFGSAPLIHTINRDSNEQYHVVFTGTGIKVYDLQGNEKTVTGDMGYVSVINPRENLRAITVADYTFITNRTGVIVNNTSLSHAGYPRGRRGIIVIRGGQFGRTIKVIVNGSEKAKVVLPDGSDAKQTPQTDAQAIIDLLYAQLTSSLSGWTINGGNGFIELIAPSGSSLSTLRVDDGFANQLAYGLLDSVQSFSKLPLEAPNGYIIKIVGDTSKTSDAFYVEYNDSTKVWKETIGWDVRLGVSNGSMPHALVRNADGSFTFQALSWAERVAGDLDTNPDPSFVGGTINDIFFYRNRLGFLSGENIIMSRTGSYFKFFPNSVANLSDDDPIDVSVSHNRISILKYAVPFSEQLLLWSDQAQFVLSSDGIMTAKSITLDLTTEFDISDGARPCGLGRGVYYASPRAAYSTINRYYAVQDVSDVKNAEDVTAHVPNYVENGVFSLSGSTTENYVAAITSGAKNRIYMYKFLYLDETIRQQSWSHWEFPEGTEVLAAEAIGSVLYLILRNESSCYAVHLNFTKETIDFVGEPYQLYMDNKKPYTIPTANYNDDLFETSLNLSVVYGMTFKHGDVCLVDTDGTVQVFREPVGGWSSSGSVLKLSGNWGGSNVFLGFVIPFRYQFSKFLIKTTDNNGFVQTQDLGRLQLRRAWLNYSSSGNFTVDVTNVSRTFSYDMTGKRLGDRDMVLGNLAIGTGQFRFPCAGEANSLDVTIRSDSTTPLNVIGCGWEGNFVNRARGI